MVKLSQFIFISRIVIFSCLLTLAPLKIIYAAAPTDDSAQQALQQLRLLQNKFNQKAEGKAAGEPSALQAVPPGSAAVPPPPLSPPSSKPPPPVTVPLPPSIASEALIEEKAYKAMEKGIFPLAPGQVKRFHKRVDEQELAETASANTPPKPTASSQFVNLSPGSTPPVIRLAQGFVSSLVFLDSTGQPWPIAAYDLGDPTSFNIQWDHTGNTLMIQAMKLYTYGNLAVRLQGLNTPVMLTLIPGQKAVDYRVDLRIQGNGPNAKGLLLDEGLPANANDVLLHVLDGVPPDGSRRLVITGGDALGWFSKNRMYIRTNLTILSPGWIASMTSADGMHAYEMMKAPVLLVSWHGKVMQLIVEGL